MAVVLQENTGMKSHVVSTGFPFDLPVAYQSKGASQWVSLV